MARRSELTGDGPRQHPVGPFPLFRFLRFFRLRTLEASTLVTAFWMLAACPSPSLPDHSLDVNQAAVVGSAGNVSAELEFR